LKSNDIQINDSEKKTSHNNELVNEKSVDYQNILNGETIYVPIYSSIFSSDSKRTHKLTATMSIHNVDLKNPIKIRKVDYYNGKGMLVKKYLENAIELKTSETTHFIIEQKDKAGGTEANFLVEWISEHKANSPLVKSVMISTSSQLDISCQRAPKMNHLGALENAPHLIEKIIDSKAVFKISHLQ